MRTAHTYVILDLSPAAYEEIRSKLEAAGYHHAFHESDGRSVIDMHGIAVAAEAMKPPMFVRCHICGLDFKGDDQCLNHLRARSHLRIVHGEDSER